MDKLNRILFIDIETVPASPDWDHVSAPMKNHWIRKANYVKTSQSENNLPEELYQAKAGIFSEFSQVICVGMGALVQQEGVWKIVLKSIVDRDEKTVLLKFCESIRKFEETHPGFFFCGHNIREFDIPFLCRRMVILGIPLPKCLRLQGKKPWEIPHLDTLDLWRFGDYKNYTSLALLAEIFEIPSPKSDMDGSQVGEVFWREDDLNRISRYCLQDVATTAKIFLRIEQVNDIFPIPHYADPD